MTNQLEKNITQEGVLELIPQRFPIVMIDELTYIDESKTHTIFSVKENDLFIEDGCLLESGLIENMAQTAAAGAGYSFKGLSEEDVPIGYIGGIKNFNLIELPKIGKQLETEVEITEVVFDVTLIKATITCENQPIASCEMKIVIVKK